MYLRRINRKKSGKNHYYWALAESYRTEKGVRQRIVGYIGDVSKKKAAGLKNQCRYFFITSGWVSPREWLNVFCSENFLKKMSKSYRKLNLTSLSVQLGLTTINNIRTTITARKKWFLSQSGWTTRLRVEMWEEYDKFSFSPVIILIWNHFPDSN